MSGPSVEDPHVQSISALESRPARTTTRPALSRNRHRQVLGGVCAGLGRHLGIDPLIVRVAFIAAAAAGGTGLLLYALAWVVMPTDDSTSREGARLWPGHGSWRTAAGVGLLVLSVLLVLRELDIWFSDALVWPIVLAACGAALIWRQSAAGRPPAAGDARDDVTAAVERPPQAEPPSPQGALRADLRAIGARAIGRASLGVALVVGAGVLFLQANDALGAVRDIVLAVLVVVVGLALILAPWWWRLVRSLAAERAERIRSQERAELGAHLHDSVLQTLALMQRRADDPRAVASLARRQERELRSWLSGTRQRQPAESLAAALEEAAAEVERLHGAAIEVVTVGDSPVDQRAEALVAASREALVNAAKFAGDSPVTLYAELTGEGAQVFVRDRGPGFDPAAVPPDRRGLRESVIGRMERQGGRARVHSTAGAGTEIELVLGRARP